MVPPNLNWLALEPDTADSKFLKKNNLGKHLVQATCSLEDIQVLVVTIKASLISRGRLQV